MWEQQTYFPNSGLGSKNCLSLFSHSPVVGGDQLGWVPEVLFES